jgi:hypothetical protein
MTTLTPRTDYHVRGRNRCMLFLSAAKESWADRTFAIKTTDGGMSFSFESWVIGPSELGYRLLEDGRFADLSDTGLPDPPHSRWFSGQGHDLDPPPQQR